MTKRVSEHYSGGGGLAAKIARDLASGGYDLTALSASDFESIDEFHFRGRVATLELLAQMNLASGTRVLDIGSGLGGLARTVAEEADVHVTGIDLTQEFCDTAKAISGWVGLSESTEFLQGDATDMSFPDNHFDGAVTMHVAMNIPDKTALYREALRVLKPGARFGIYDILQGEGGEVPYPAPWASEPSISHLATPQQMTECLTAAGFKILAEADSTRQSLAWLQDRTLQPKPERSLPVTTRLLFGDTAKAMTRNQLLALSERRMLTYTYICEA